MHEKLHEGIDQVHGPVCCVHGSRWPVNRRIGAAISGSENRFLKWQFSFLQKQQAGRMRHSSQDSKKNNFVYIQAKKVYSVFIYQGI